MPIYEYECSRCGAHSERRQRFTEPALKQCPECGGDLRKLVSLSSFHLKGSGWYSTDYKRKNAGSNGNGGGEEKPKDKAETTTATATEKSAATTTDTTK